MSTLHLRFGDRAIRAAQADPAVTRLRDARWPLELRFRAGRQRASWFLVWHAGARTHYRKIGDWPSLPAGRVIGLVPDLLAEVARQGDQARAAVDHWSHVAELLGWYRERVQVERRLSASWRATVRSVVDRHLTPRIGLLPLTDLDRRSLDAQLMAPLQATLGHSTIALVWRVLRNACRRATRLGYLARDPLDGVVLRDFIPAAVSYGHGVLRAVHVPQVMAAMHGCEPPVRTLLMLMLCHGTRVGETRRARWDHVDLVGGEWYIPAAHTKTGREHRLPLTAALAAWLTQYRDWQGAAGRQCALLFPGRDLRRPISARDVSRLVADASDGQWTARSLRSLARTVWADLGVDYLTGERLLNHQLRQLDTAYIHSHMALQCRRALETHQAWLAERGSMQFDADAPRQSADDSDSQQRAAPAVAR